MSIASVYLSVGSGTDLHSAVIASIEMAQKYQCPVYLTFNWVTVEIPPYAVKVNGDSAVTNVCQEIIERSSSLKFK